MLTLSLQHLNAVTELTQVMLQASEHRTAAVHFVISMEAISHLTQDICTKLNIVEMSRDWKNSLATLNMSLQSKVLYLGLIMGPFR